MQHILSCCLSCVFFPTSLTCLHLNFRNTIFLCSCFLNAVGLPSVLECVNKDKAKVQFVKNKNKCGGARQAGSGHERLKQIPVPDQGKQRTGQKAAQSCLSQRTG